MQSTLKCLIAVCIATWGCSDSAAEVAKKRSFASAQCEALMAKLKRFQDRQPVFVRCSLSDIGASAHEMIDPWGNQIALVWEEWIPLDPQFAATLAHGKFVYGSIVCYGSDGQQGGNGDAEDITVCCFPFHPSNLRGYTK
jgi:hypothetical protein